MISNIFTLIVWPIFQVIKYALCSHPLLSITLRVKTGRNKKIMADFLDPFFLACVPPLIVFLWRVEPSIRRGYFARPRAKGSDLGDKLMLWFVIWYNWTWHLFGGEQLLISSWIGYGCWSFMSSCRDHMCAQNRSWWWKSQDPFQLEI